MDAHHHGGPVVIGMDGSGSALDAVLKGAAEAARHNLPLRLVAAFGSVSHAVLDWAHCSVAVVRPRAEDRS